MLHKVKNMTEIELKFNIQSLSALKKNINSAGAELVYDRRYEKTTMFDNETELMQITDGRIRVRTSGARNEISYKKPITREGIKKEIEYETEVKDAKIIELILKEMGFLPTSSYERYRTEYILDNVKITIDEYPFDNFVELEGRENDILNIASLLKLDITQNITLSCDTLFLKWREARGLMPKMEMSFDGYDK